MVEGVVKGIVARVDPNAVLQEHEDKVEIPWNGVGEVIRRRGQLKGS